MYDRWFAERNRHQTTKFEVTWVRPDGEEVHTLTSIMHISGRKGRSKGAFVAITNISELPQIEGELSDSREILRRLSRHLQFIREKDSKRIAREIHETDKVHEASCPSADVEHVS